MSSYANLMTMGGAARGLTRGLDDMDRRKRLDRQDARADARANRDAEYHNLRMRQGEMQLDEAQVAQEHAEFSRNMDAAVVDFLNSGNTVGIEYIYNEQYPDGNEMKIQEVGDGQYVLDFGARGKSQPMTQDQVVGLATAMKDPELYLQERKDRMAAEQEREQKLTDEETKHKRAKELKRLESSLRAGEKEPSYKTDDQGRMWALSRGKASPLEVPEGVEPPIFRGQAAGRGSPSKMLQEIDAIAQRLAPVEGETPDQRWMRAAEERSRLIGKNDPSAAVREYEKAITAKIIGADDISASDPKGERLVRKRELIRQMVEDFAQRYSESADSLDADPLDLGL